MGRWLLAESPKHTHMGTMHQGRTILVINDGGTSICKPNVKAAAQSKLCPLQLFTSMSPFTLGAPFLFFAPPLNQRLLPDSFICHVNVKGVLQLHCDTLGRQYKYLISPNGNHHRALIVPHIIRTGKGEQREGGPGGWFTVSLQHSSPFDSLAVSPFLLSVYEVYFWFICRYLANPFASAVCIAHSLPLPSWLSCHSPLSSLSSFPSWTSLSTILSSLCIVTAFHQFFCLLRLNSHDNQRQIHPELRGLWDNAWLSAETLCNLSLLCSLLWQRRGNVADAAHNHLNVTRYWTEQDSGWTGANNLSIK